MDKWWSDRDVAVVTGAPPPLRARARPIRRAPPPRDPDAPSKPAGANKGIGFEIARLLAEAGWSVVVAARSPELGEAAAARIRALPAVAAARPERVAFQQLDIADAASIKARGREGRGEGAPPLARWAPLRGRSECSVRRQPPPARPAPPQAARDALAARFPGGITALVNNAGCAFKGAVGGGLGQYR
jgi:NAD(P)-dependent dehydrogenase (short-subunit alcohol dehydrogenase family)